MPPSSLLSPLTPLPAAVIQVLELFCFVLLFSLLFLFQPISLVKSFIANRNVPILCLFVCYFYFFLLIFVVVVVVGGWRVGWGGGGGRGLLFPSWAFFHHLFSQTDG